MMMMTRVEWRKVAREAQGLSRQSTIDAIKYLREATGCGLKQAHDAVRRLQSLREIKEERTGAQDD